MPYVAAFSLLDPSALDVAWVAILLRAAWLFPDWLGKWRRLRGGPPQSRVGSEGEGSGTNADPSTAASTVR